MKNHRYALLLLLLLFFYPDLYAQYEIERSVIASSGSNTVSSDQLSMSWTAGEAVIGTAITGTITLTSGFQQADTDERVSVKNPKRGIDFKVYPNPTFGEFNIEIESSAAPQNVNYNIYSSSGQRINTGKSEIYINGKVIERVSITDCAAGSYYMQLLTEQGKALGTIKIIKSK